MEIIFNQYFQKTLAEYKNNSITRKRYTDAIQKINDATKGVYFDRNEYHEAIEKAENNLENVSEFQARSSDLAKDIIQSSRLRCGFTYDILNGKYAYNPSLNPPDRITFEYKLVCHAPNNQKIFQTSRNDNLEIEYVLTHRGKGQNNLLMNVGGMYAFPFDKLPKFLKKHPECSMRERGHDAIFCKFNVSLNDAKSMSDVGDQIYNITKNFLGTSVVKVKRTTKSHSLHSL